MEFGGKTVRMRRKPWARPELAASPFVIDKPEEFKGRWSEAFADPDQPLYVELGCGKGGFIAQKAFDTPDINFLAVDIKSEVLAVGRRTADKIFAEGGRTVDNLRLTAYNIEHIENVLCVEDNVQKIYINFCNPWPKPRDFKHRLTHTRQLEKYKLFLQPGCEIVFKTDDDMLFRFTKEYFPEAGYEIVEIIEDLPASHPASAIITEHELKFRSMGLPIHYIRAVLPQKENSL